MKQKKEDYFFIELSHLKDRKIFPFHLYVYNPVNQTYTFFLAANNPLTRDKKELLEFICAKNGQIAILNNQQLTFMRSMNLSVYDIPSLYQEPTNELEKARFEREKEAQKAEKFEPKQEMSQLLETNNFMAFIEAARREISLFSLRVSHTVSLATFFAEEFMYQDTHLNRVVALSYFMAKVNDILDEESLADLVCAAFLAHIGQTQYAPKLVQMPWLQMDSSQQQSYQKHYGHSMHMIRRSQVELSPRCLKIIEQHHERVDGSGYPNQLKADHIEQLSLILGMVSHVFEYSNGMITGSPISLERTVSLMKSKSKTAGLEFMFGDTILSTLTYLIKSDTHHKAA